jgi:phosphate transport system protein
MTAAPHRHFDDELTRLKDRLLQMSAAAQESLDRAVRSVLQRDLEVAERVIDQDPAIDALEIEIEETVTNLLALHQPMARDLRLLLAALKISNDLERVGDHAVNIAICAKRLTDYRMIAPEPELVEMGRLSRDMLSSSIDAFVRRDADAGRAVCRQDDQVDALHRSMFRILITHMAEDAHTIGAAMELFLVSRNLERVADLATNIAEDVVFLVEGKSIKHGAERQSPKAD